MRICNRSLAAVVAGGLCAWSANARAVTLTTSLSAFDTAVGMANLDATPLTGLFDPLALNLPTTSTVTLTDGQTFALSNMAQVTQPQDGFPFLLSDGFSGDLLIPQNAAGTQISNETLSPSSAITAFGFDVVPFSSTLGGPYNVTVALAGGQTTTVALPGGSFGNGTTTPAFFGYYGGPVSSLTISTTDTNGLAFGNFIDAASATTAVPEPASAGLLLTGLGLIWRVRRRAV